MHLHHEFAKTNLKGLKVSAYVCIQCLMSLNKDLALFQYQRKGIYKTEM